MAAPLRCPSCAVVVPDDAPAFPFCSKRCRLHDLDAWITGRYVVSRPLEARDLEELEATLEGRAPSSRVAADEGERADGHDDEAGA